MAQGGAHQCCFFSGLMTSPLLFLQRREAHNELPTAAWLTQPTVPDTAHSGAQWRTEYRNRRPLFPPHCQEDCTRNSQRLLESHWIRECWPPQFRVGKLCAIFCSSKKRWSLESLEFEEHVVIAQWTFAMARSPIVDSRSVV